MIGWTWLGLAALAQEPADDAFERAKARHLRVQSAGMGVLAGWSGVNLAGGGIAWALEDDPRREGFWGGNAAWNVVNLGIATAGLASVGGKRKSIRDGESLLRSQQNLERSLLLNIGLDVGYMLAGWALRERGQRLGQPGLEGLGDALVVQGGFLFTFDLALFTASKVSRRHERYDIRFKTMP